ncbi:hypothetical protein [Conexibacter woesei]|uniref:hypothetical protein n=1 Tax=Conexibacter woesei TaxID=191495 RepID=UPI0012DD5058|nr:hypothetical protein [Conexibacter woesei]
MSLRTFFLAAALSTAAVVPAAAQADAPWSAPAALEGATTPSTGPLGAITARGTAALTASNPSTETAPADHPTQLVRMDAGGRVLASDGLSFVAQGVTTYGATGLAAAGETLGTQYPGTLDDTSRLVVSAMSGAGAIRSTTISGLHGFGVFALAGDPQGNVALLVFNTRERIVYLRKKGSSTFTKVLTIKVSDQARGATLAVGGKSGGELLVAYEDHHTLYARHRGTRSWGSVHQLGDSVQSDISAAFDGSGRESVAWKSQRINEGESNTPAVVSFTTAAPGRGFGARRQIESVSGPSGAGHYVSSPAVLLRVIDGAHTLLTWTGSDGTNFVVKAETIASGHTATPATLSPAGSDAVLGDASVAPSGAALVLWRSNTAGADATLNAPAPRVTAAYRAPGAASFGAAEPVSAATDQQPVLTGLVDPATGRAIAAWAPVSSAVQFATRPGN